jgi:hypothetical protein
MKPEVHLGVCPLNRSKRARERPLIAMSGAILPKQGGTAVKPSLI